MTSQPIAAHSELFQEYGSVRLRYDAGERTLWIYMSPTPRPCFTPELLENLLTIQDRILAFNACASLNDGPSVEYAVVASSHPEAWSLGGDLDLFTECIEQRDRERLRTYAKACINIGYWNCSGGDHKPTVISLVQGNALGGGFEGALSAPVIVAEEQCNFGLPEVLFNLFPGMGAWSYLSRRLNPATAEHMILSGQLYAARKLHELHVIQAVSPTGLGEQATVDTIHKLRRRSNSHSALTAIRHRWNPVDYGELLGITEEWVEAALRLTPRDLRHMRRLLRAQKVRDAGPAQVAGNP